MCPPILPKHDRPLAPTGLSAHRARFEPNTDMSTLNTGDSAYLQPLSRSAQLVQSLGQIIDVAALALHKAPPVLEGDKR
jgi:hypothetical protein